MSTCTTLGPLGTLALNELQALAVVGALRREMERLEGLAGTCRARGEQDAWALFTMQRHALAPIRGAVLDMLGSREAGASTCAPKVDLREPGAAAAVVPAVAVEASPAPPLPEPLPVVEPPPKRPRGRPPIRYGRRKGERIDRAGVVAAVATGEPPGAIRRRFNLSHGQLQQIVGQATMREGAAGSPAKAFGEPVAAQPSKHAHPRRPVPVDREAVRAMVAAGSRPADVRRAFGISKTYLYRILRQPSTRPSA